jgi:GNAT superfamily N-acetyltransferase
MPVGHLRFIFILEQTLVTRICKLGIQIIRLAGVSDIGKLIPAFKQLRPHRPATQLRQLIRQAFQEGYRIAYIGDRRLAWSVLGFRIQTFVFSGKTLKIDDLVTLDGHENKGYASILFRWTKDYALQENCDHICLDSGFHRHQAYRFYLNHGLAIESLHFGRKLSEM